MALLLAMYQKMRLIREKNQATLDLTKYSDKLERITKNLERQQKRFTSLFAQLDQESKRMESNARLMFQTFAGLGTNNYAGSLNPMGFSGMNGFVYDYARKACQNDIPDRKDAQGNVITGCSMNDQIFQELYAHYMQNGGRGFKPVYDSEDKSKVVKDAEGNPTYECGYSHKQITAFQQAISMGQMQQQQNQAWVQQTSQQYSNNVSIWVEARKAELEAEQDSIIEPLTYQQTMMELEKNHADARLKRINAQIESYDQLASQEAEKSAPTFGLR